VKILNLYAGIGGNRRLWENNHEITAIELNPEIANIYSDLFPRDKVIVADAHQYLLEHFFEYDFIWSSPPCQTHSSFRQNICVRFRGTKPEYPDMRLYQEIIFLQNNFKGKWIVENVRPYYKPLMSPTIELQRHLFWANFEIKHAEFKKEKIRTFQIKDLQNIHGFELSRYKLPNKRQILRNCVLPELGLHILKNYDEIQRIFRR
jgi:DNA (cytosine-5)-methyltransferase 1